LFLVAEADEQIVGYVVALEAADEGEILNLAVAEAGRRRGLGRALVEAIVVALTDRGVRQIYLEVRESNAPARALYSGFGFKEVGRRKAYYRRPVEDEPARSANGLAMNVTDRPCRSASSFMHCLSTTWRSAISRISA